MDNLKDFFIGAVAIANMFFVSYFGIFTPLLYLVIALMVMDLATRVYAAAISEKEKVESKKVLAGIGKKLGMCFLIVLTMLMDAGLTQIANTLGISIATKIIFTALILAWIFIRELISNMENLISAGIELPEFIMKALRIARDKVDDAADSVIGGEHENI